MVDGEKQSDKLVLTAPPLPRRYHWSVLSLAHGIFEAGGGYIINPHIPNASLMQADTDWLADFANYRKWLAFERDKAKRPKELM